MKVRLGHIRAVVGLAALSAFIPDLASAQARPFGECRAGYWSSNRNLDDQTGIPKATCFVNWRPAFGEGLRFGLNARAGLRDEGEARGGDGRVREAFGEFESGPWTFRLGRQIIAWGRSDRINPTDSLSPRDFTFLTPEDDEQRDGIDAVVVRRHLSEALSMSAVLARFEAHVIPQGSLPANRRAPSEPSRGELALKLDHTGAGIDWSVSYFDGHERFARHRVAFAAPMQPVFLTEFEKKRTLGADFATAVGAWTLRGEFSYSDLNGDCQGCSLARRKLAQAVIGMDRDFWDTGNVNAQVFFTRRSDRDSAASLPLMQALERLNSEFSERESGVTLRLSNRFLNDRLRAEVSGIADFTHRSGVLRPRVSYAFSDALKLSVGADHFRGRPQSFFGARKRNNVGFAELTVVY